MGKLSGALCYLSGPMDRAKDFGVGWRKDFINLTKDLDIVCIDPTNKPKGLDDNSVEEDMSVSGKLKEQGQWEELTEYVKKYRRYDLRFVDLADFIITYIDPQVHMCGTYNEVFEAERQKKPRFAIVEGGLKKMPSWLFAVFKWQHVFSTSEECIEHLKKLNSGELPLNDNWVLVRKHLK